MILSLIDGSPLFSLRSITERGRFFPEIGAGQIRSILLTKHAISCILMTVLRIQVTPILITVWSS
jgi:hypothetical protein